MGGAVDELAVDHVGQPLLAAAQRLLGLPFGPLLRAVGAARGMLAGPAGGHHV